MAGPGDQLTQQRSQGAATSSQDCWLTLYKYFNDNGMGKTHPIRMAAMRAWLPWCQDIKRLPRDQHMALFKSMWNMEMERDISRQPSLSEVDIPPLSPGANSESQNSLRLWLFERATEALSATLARVRFSLQGPKKRSRCHKHWEMILQHLEPAHQPVGPHILPRMATFHPQYFIEAGQNPAHQHFPAGDVEIHTMDQVTGCRVLCATMEQLTLAKAGLGLPRFAFVYIPSRDRTGRTYLTDTLLEELQLPRHRSDKVDVQNYVPHQRKDPTVSLPLAEVLRVLQDSTIPAPFGPDGSDRPLNLLDLNGDLPGHQDSEIVDRLNLTLLDHLHKIYLDSLHNYSGINKKHHQPAALVDAGSCSRFHLVAQPGATSGWHADILNCTWIEVLRGYKTWTIVDSPPSDELWDSYFAAGIHWTPNPSICKTFLLAPGDTLVMLPGFTPHLVGTIGTLKDPFTHVIGGQVVPRDPAHLTDWFRALRKLYNHPAASNEPVPRQIPDLLNVLRGEMEESIAHGSGEYEPRHLVELAEFIQDVRPRLSCECEVGKCAAKCPCRNGERANMGGCTAWCHGGEGLDALRECGRGKKVERGTRAGHIGKDGDDRGKKKRARRS
jgi:hypothetical protein